MQSLAPLQEGLYKTVGGLPYLTANHCDSCERTFFPARQYCGCCCKPNLRELCLSRTGKLHSYSIVDRKPKHSVIEPPYVMAEIAMPEDVHVFTVLRCKDFSELRVGMDVELQIAEVPNPKGDGTVQAYVFEPVDGGAQ